MAKERIYSKGELIGPYEVVRTLSAGGMGIVYEAVPQREMRDDLLSLGITRVAVKVARLDARELERHERRVLAERSDREFQTMLGLTALAHPNVVSVFDRGWEDAVPYYVMEMVDGVTLGELLEGRPRVGQAVHLFGKLCGAVAFLHHGGICHRDLKPSNVMVRAEDGEPVLIDFGICLPPTGRTLTGAGELLGTPAYLSPEYAAHWMDPERTRPYLATFTDDVWALGVMLYEAFTGRLPWRTPSDRHERLLREIQTVQPPHPSDVYARAPRPLGDVVMRMLEKNPRLRVQNASEVLTLLGAAAEASDVLSPLPPRQGQRGKGLTSGSTPTERVPGPFGNERGHIAGRMVAGMLVLLAVYVAGLVTPMARKGPETRQAAPEETHGAKQPGTRQPEAQPAPESGEAASPTPPRTLKISRGTPMPKRAYSDQMKPPCVTGETTIVGGCWREVDVEKADGGLGGECPEDLHELKVKDGWKCYAVVKQGEPASLEPDKRRSAQ